MRSGLDPDEAIAKAVEYYVAVALCWFGLPVKPRESCIETAALPVVIHHYVFAGCQCLGVEILNSDTVGGWFVSRVDSELVRGHLYTLAGSLRSGSRSLFLLATCLLNKLRGKVRSSRSFGFPCFDLSKRTG